MPKVFRRLVHFDETAPRILRNAGYLGPNGLNYIPLVATAFLISLRPTTIALLKLFDRLGFLKISDCCLVVIRLTTEAVVWAFDLGIKAFSVMLLLLNLSDGIVAIALSLQELSLRGYRSLRGLWYLEMCSLSEKPAA